MKELKINSIEIKMKKGYAIKQNVNLVFNSANGLLLMRTGIAKKIREFSEKLNKRETKEYFKLLNNFTNPLIKKYITSFNVKKWKPKKAQLSCFKKIKSNKGPFKLGEVILDKNGPKKQSKHILHVVGMTYHLTNNKLCVNKVKEKILKNVLKKGLKLANENNYKTISIPVLCTRGDYGLHPKKSLNAIKNAIKESRLPKIKKIIICFEREGPKKYFDSLK